MLHAISNRVIWDEGGGPSHTTKFNPFEIAPSGLTTVDRKSTRLNSSHGYISYAVFCLKKKKKRKVNFISIKSYATIKRMQSVMLFTYYNPVIEREQLQRLEQLSRCEVPSGVQHVAGLS